MVVITSLFDDYASRKRIWWGGHLREKAILGCGQRPKRSEL
jgi:hypothetical protein